MYSVNPIGASDTITMRDQAAAHNAGALYVEAVTILDRFNEASIQAEAIEVLSSEGATYETTETVAFTDTAAKS